jgi:hypothetical protein
MYCVDLPENALFSSYGVICVQPLPSTLPGELSMERMNISGLFSRYKVCSFSNSCYKTTADKSDQLGHAMDMASYAALALLLLRSRAHALKLPWNVEHA